MLTAFAGYRESLQEDRRLLLDRYELKDIAIKVVGVGSVGTYCSIVLLMASEKDPLFLQVKQARTSVLEPYAGKSIHPNRGQRIVPGCRLMQSASDLFLGWTEIEGGPAFPRPPAQGHEDQARRGGVHAERHGPVCRGVRMDPGTRPRPIRRAREDQRLPGQE